jgi:hypothetical protein
VQHGCLEIDERNRRNFLLCLSTGSQIGTRHKRGRPVGPIDTFLAAKSSASSEAHVLGDSWTRYGAQRCERCGGNLR